MLGHRSPGCDLAAAVEYAVELAREALLKERFAIGAKPRGPRKKASPTASATPKKGGQRSRHVPAEVRREVVARDGLRCAYVDPDTGQRCGSTRGGLELEHHVPFARGGDHDAGGVSVYCRAHNQFTARRAFGAQQIALAIAHRTRRAAPQEALG